VINIDNNK